jgi:ribonucleoside-diphosphate reductase alpha chain
MTLSSGIPEKIFKMKYAIREDETWEQMCWRVSSYVAQNEEEVDYWSAEFFKFIYNQLFIPGGRILKNSGTDVKNLYNCFFFNLEDSRTSIYETLKDTAEVLAWGGGVGLRFSELREKGALIKSSNTPSSGPLSFIDLFNLTGDVIQQASRRGAMIGLLDISHPDILDFFNSKSTLSTNNKKVISDLDRITDKKQEFLTKVLIDNQLTHFNISTEVTDKFMQAVENDEDWHLISPNTAEVKQTMKARDLLMLMSKHIYESGDPGIIFKDTILKDNMVHYISDIVGTNPCAEITLLSHEPCDLASINLYKVYDMEAKQIDYELLESVVRTAVRFLDNIHDVSYTTVDKVNEMAKGLRRIGLGVMGFADLLAEMNIPYDSDDAEFLADYISWFISYFAWLESISLASEKGAFPYYDKDKVDLHVVEKVLNSPFAPITLDIEKIKEVGFRNVSVTALAPTGTISLLADVNSVVEPFFALAYKRHITQGIENKALDTIIMTNPILERKLRESIPDADLEKIAKKILKSGSIQNIEEIPAEIKRVFKTSNEIEPEDHIRIQAAWQKYVSNSVSKTINLKESATVEDIYNALILMWKNNLKSSTLYRNNSKLFQILNAGN